LVDDGFCLSTTSIGRITMIFDFHYPPWRRQANHRHARFTAGLTRRHDVVERSKAQFIRFSFVESRGSRSCGPLHRKSATVHLKRNSDPAARAEETTVRRDASDVYASHQLALKSGHFNTSTLDRIWFKDGGTRPALK
jgi:hypothetical protein